MTNNDLSIPGPKRALYEQFAQVAKALGNPQRLEIIEHLAQGPRSVEVLAGKLDLPIANVSQHLQAMRKAGLVTSVRDGKFVIYRLADDSALAAAAAIRMVAERHSSEMQRVVRGWFDQRDSMEPISRSELVSRMKDGAVTVLDVRPADEFALGHLPGAINMPVAELERHLSALDGSLEVVAYCRGPWCVMSFEAVAELRKHGFKARRLEEGLPEWRAAGLAVEQP